MKVVHRDGLIPIKMIRPHPDNPRKELGDLTELAESIKANGIFQNLTVLAMTSDENDEDFYTCLIGHRRLAAAGLAGLDNVPCMVVEMDEKEQIATMLLENMQRSDLTVYEQAQGFQMMLDLGETQDTIAEKTGFSKTTVRHRLKLLELDPEEFKKSQERQVSLSDYIELEKIKDPALKNKALKAIGTSNFQWTVQSVFNEEKYKENIKDWKDYLNSLGAEEVKYKNKTNYSQIYNYYVRSQSFDSMDTERIESLEKPFYYTFDQYGYLYILGEEKDETPAAEPEWKIKERERQAKIDMIKEVENRAQELRLEFVKKFGSGGRHLGAIVDMMVAEETQFCDADWQHVAKLCGITIDEDDEEDAVKKLRQDSEYTYLLWKHPETVLFAILADTIEDWGLSSHDYNGGWKKNETLERWYDLLAKLGYRISDDEKRLLDGTHECFEEDKECQ